MDSMIITSVYVTLLNGQGMRLTGDDEILSPEGFTISIDELPEYLKDSDAMVRIKTKASEYETMKDAEDAGEFDEDEAWKRSTVTKAPTYVAYDHLYGRAVGNIVSITDKEIAE